jgi:hemerythrin-like metal-binding protein
MSQPSLVSGSQQLPASQNIESALAWVEELTLQNEELNTDHKALLEKLNNLLFALGCTDLDRIAPALAVLYAEAEMHFAKENDLMFAVDYPHRTAHIEKHKQLLDGVGQIGFALTSGHIAWTPAGALPLLEQWFVPHLTYADRRLANFIDIRNTASRIACPSVRGTNNANHL